MPKEHGEAPASDGSGLPAKLDLPDPVFSKLDDGLFEQLANRIATRVLAGLDAEERAKATFRAAGEIGSSAKTLYDGSGARAVVTTKEALHQLVDELPDDQAELARQLLEDLRHASDGDGPPLDSEILASLDRGLADISAGRVKPLEEYERERGL